MDQQRLPEVCIVDIEVPDYQTQIYSELMVAMTSELTRAGFNVRHTVNATRAGAINIVFGFYKLFLTQKDLKFALPGNVFLFNLAPLSGRISWMSRYIEALSRFPVIDYSCLNQKILLAVGGRESHLFKFGYASLSPYSFPERRKNLLFYGALTPHRLERLEALKMGGNKIEVLSNSWGCLRDMKVATASAVLNLGKFPGSIFEVYRVWHSLCLGTPVISEVGSDPDLSAYWSRYTGMIRPGENQSIDLTRIPSPDLYREETSFQRECLDLMDWARAKTVSSE